MGKVKPAVNGKKAAQPLAKVKTSKSEVVSKSKSKPVAQKVSSDEDDESSDDSDESADSASESDSAGSGSDDSSDSESDSEASDDSSSEEKEEKPKKAVAKPAANGVAKVNGAKANGTKANGVKPNGKAKDDSSDESSDSSESDEEAKDGSDDSESDSSDSDEEEDNTKAKKKEEATVEDDAFSVKKRKALEDPHPSEWAKKQKTQDGGDRSATLFVGNLAWSVDDNKLYSTFGDCEGIVGARVITEGQGGRSKGFGYVDFSNPEAASAALDLMNKYELDGRALNVDLSSSKPKTSDANGFRDRANDRARNHNDQLSAPSETLFVGNLPFDVDEDTIRNLFGEVAEVVSCRLPTDPESGNLKGFGYITFGSTEDAQAVLDAKNGAPIGWKGRPCRLDFASSRPNRDGGGGGGGRGGRGGRGGFRGGRGGAPGGGRGGFKPRGGFGNFQGTRTTF